jgi:rare lipoprotein A
MSGRDIVRMLAGLIAGALVIAVASAFLMPIRGFAAEQRCGVASWYGPGFHGRTAASGETYNQNAMTAAHKTLPFGTKLRVTSQATGKSVTVKINDRGPYHGGRIIDLSKAAASQLGLIQPGTGKVCLTRL